MKITANLVALTLGLSLAAGSCLAQQEDVPNAGEDEMSHAFGKENGLRGTVTAANAGTFTVRTEEGEMFRVFYSVNTRLMKDRQPIEAGDIHVGDMLFAGGIVDSKAKTVGAVLLFDVDVKQIQEARAAFGKTWVAGKVTGIHDLKITVQRADDKHVYVVAVDENTSFHKRREDVTLADIKVGDFITAQGALHGDAFLASNLRVMTGRGPAGDPDFGHPHKPDAGQQPSSATPHGA